MIKNWIEKIKNKLSALKRKKPETQKPEQGLSLNDLSETEKDLAPLQKKKSIDWKHLTQKIKSQWLYLKTLKADDIVNHFKKIFKQAKQIKLNKETGQKVFEVGNKFKKQAASIDWQKIPDKIFSPESRGIINRAFVVSTIVCVSYGTGKTLALLSKGKDQSLERKAVARPPIATKDLTTAELKMISDTNIFRTETKAKEDGSGRKRIDRNTKCLAATQKTSLPITLVNTVVLQDTVKSIAAVQLRTGKDPVNVREGEVIAKLAKVDKITRLELILKNLKTGNCEFLSNDALLKKKESPINVLSPSASREFKTSQKPKGIENEGNNFKISKKFLQSQMSDISSLLTQARAIKLTNPDGSMSFKITEIVPGSVFANLGIQNDDIITSINGSKITDMNQVMSLFSKIQTLEHLSMDVQREGSKVPLDYTLKD